jgi:hypothetical protein
MDFGKMIAEISENREKENTNSNEKMAIKLLPTFEETEKIHNILTHLWKKWFRK